MKTMVINAGTIAGRTNFEEESKEAFAHLQEKGYTVIALADGEHSAVGASIAAATSVEEALDSLLLGNDIDEALHRGVLVARDVLLSRESTDLNCSLSLAIVSQDHWGIALIGNSYAVVSHDVVDHELFHRQRYTETSHLLVDDDFSPVYLYGEGKLTAVSLASDGMVDVALAEGLKKTEYSFWVPVVQKTLDEGLLIEDLLERLKSKGEIKDDATLVMAAQS